MGRARFRREDSGQTVVLVALMFTVLMGFAALGIDVGRFYSERRYLQDAVDAAALACAYKYAQSGQPSEAWLAADEILQNRNLLANPLGIDVTYPRPFTAALVYDGPNAPQNLIGGILPVNNNGLGCRVAITVQVPTFLIKIVSPALNTISMTTRGYAKSLNGFLPSVVKRWENGPGPGNGNVNQFIDHIMKEGFDYQCTITNPSACTVAQNIPGEKGREFVLFGQSAKATNDSSFRGYIALDIRDFTSTDGSGNLLHMETEPGSGLFNLVDITSSVNTLKLIESDWILKGYSGPPLCPAVSGTFEPCAQLAVLNGSNSGIFVEDYEDRYNIGDKLLLQLYDGTVKTVPDFNISSGTLTLPMDGTGTSTVQYTFSPQFAISGATVTTTLIPDNGTMTTDGGGTSTNPFLNGCATMSSPEFSANPTLPNQSTYTQIWNTITTSGCDKGIFQAWLRGTSSAPYTSRVHETLVNINVGGQARDFSLASSDAFVAIASPGDPADFVIRTTTASGGSTKWTGNNLLTLSWAKCPTTTDPSILPPEVLVCGIDGVTGATSVTNVDPGENHTFNVQTTLARSSEIYKGWVRETGLDDVTNKRVTHLLEVTIEVGIIPGGATQYADVLGYAVFEVTLINSNEVWGRAITGAYLDPNDPAIAIGRKIGLVPWEEP